MLVEEGSFFTSSHHRSALCLALMWLSRPGGLLPLLQLQAGGTGEVNLGVGLPAQHVPLGGLQAEPGHHNDVTNPEP